MAYPEPKNIPPLPKDLSHQKIVELKEALQVMLPEELGLSGAQAKAKLKTENYNWRSPKQLSDFVKDKTAQKDVKAAEYVLSWWQENSTQPPEYSEGTTTMTGAPEYPVESTTLTPDQLKDLQRQAEEVKEKREKTIKEAETSVPADIKRQQEARERKLQEIEEQKKAAEAEKTKAKAEEEYAKVKEKEVPDQTQDQKELRAGFVTAANEDPIGTIKITHDAIAGQVGDSIPDDTIWTTSIYAVASATPSIRPQVRETLTKEWAKQNPEVVDWTKSLTDQSKTTRELAEEVAKAAFGPNQTLIPEYLIETSSSPQPGYEPVSMSFIPTQVINLAETKSEVLNKPEVAERPEFMISWLEKQLDVAQKGIQGAPKAFDDGLVQGYFSNLAGAYTPQEASVIENQTDWQAKTIKASGLSDISGVVGGVANIGLRKIGNKVIGKAIGKVATKVGISAATTAAGGATGAAIGGEVGTLIPIPVLGTVLGTIIGWLSEKVFSKINWKRIKEWSAAAVGITVAFIIGPFFGLGAGILAGGVGTLTSMALGAKLGNLTLAAMGTWIVNFFGTLGGAVAASVGVAMVVIIVTVPVLIALILFIINSSAYVVPPSLNSSLMGYDNPYMSVTKSANQDKIANPSGKTTITYTVTITALKGSLSNIRVTNTSCKVTKKNETKVNCPNENIPKIPEGATASPSTPYTFTFSIDFDSSFANSTVFDSIEITADSLEEKDVVTSGSEAVCIGDCPTSCIKVVDNARTWPSNLRSNVEQAATIIASHQSFASRACGGGDVNVCFDPSQIDPKYFAWHKHTTSCDVIFNEKGVQSERDAAFLLTHEVTHHIQDLDSGTVRDYVNSGGYNEVAASGFCTYSDTKGSRTESMAEAAGLYVSIPSWGSCASNYRNKYPKNFVWAQGFVK